MTLKKTLKLLKIIKRKKVVSRYELEQLADDDNLFWTALIEMCHPHKLGEFNHPLFCDDDLFQLSDKGLDFLSQHKKDVIRTWLPHIISNSIAFLALILSIISIAMQLSQ